MTTAFQRASTLVAVGKGRFTATFDSSWRQGRAMFGGVQAALLARAILAVAPDPAFRLRTLTCHFCAPALDGAAEVSAEIANAGSSVMHATARITQSTSTGQSSETIALATAVLARERAVDLALANVSMPPAPPTNAVPEVSMGLEAGGPAFAQYYSFRPCLGQRFFSSAKEATTGGWVRLREPALLDIPAAVALTDAWAPSVFAALAQPRPAATVALTYHIYADLPYSGLAPEDYCLFTGHTDIVHHGYCAEVDELWSPSGQLLVRAYQMVAVIK